MIKSSNHNQLFFLLVVSGVLTLLSLSSIKPTSAPTQSEKFTLENGLQVALLQQTHLPLIHLVLGLNVGSKNETRETSGLTHLLEHYLLFRNPHRLNGKNLSLAIREKGGYYNAHTGRDLMLIEITLPAGNYLFALKCLKALAFELTFDPASLEEEKQVILEEISFIQDDPLRYGTSLTFQHLFPSHPYSQPIYGTPESLAQITVEKITAFYQRFFCPQNAALAVVGPIDLNWSQEKITQIFSSLSNAHFSPPSLAPAPPLKEKIEVSHSLDVNQAYLFLGFSAPDFNHPDQYAIDVLTEILGRGLNPLLNQVLRGRRELAYTVTMSYTSLYYGGAMIITLTLDPKNTKRAERETIRFLKTLRRQNFSPDDYYGEAQLFVFDFLQQAKNQICFRTYQAQENGLTLARALVRYYLLNQEKERGNYLELIKKISSSDLREAAGKYLSKGKYVVVRITPLNKEK